MIRQTFTFHNWKGCKRHGCKEHLLRANLKPWNIGVRPREILQIGTQTCTLNPWICFPGIQTRCMKHMVDISNECDWAFTHQHVEANKATILKVESKAGALHQRLSAVGTPEPRFDRFVAPSTRRPVGQIAERPFATRSACPNSARSTHCPVRETRQHHHPNHPTLLRTRQSAMYGCCIKPGERFVPMWDLW